MTTVVIASAARTAVGTFGGGFANTPVHDLGATVPEAVVARAGIEKDLCMTPARRCRRARHIRNVARHAKVFEKDEVPETILGEA